jgi:hypothetical protein
MRQVFVYIDVLLLGDGDSVTFYSNTSSSPAIYRYLAPSPLSLSRQGDSSFALPSLMRLYIAASSPRCGVVSVQRSRTGPYTEEDTLQLIGSYPGEPLIVRFVGTSTTAKNLGAYFQAGKLPQLCASCSPRGAPVEDESHLLTRALYVVVVVCDSVSAGRCLKGIQKLTQSTGTFSDGSGWAADYTERSDCGFLIGGTRA